MNLTQSAPPHQTQRDLDAEESMRKRMEKKWNVQFCKLMDKRFYVDFSMHKGPGELTVGFCEFKRRYKGNFGLAGEPQTYDTALIPVHKLKHAHDWATFCNVPFFYIVEWNDGMVYWRWHPAEQGRLNLESRLWHDRERNANGDREPHFLIPQEWFKPCFPVQQD